MKPFVTLVALLFSACFFQLNAAPNGSDELKVVTAGDTITFDLSLDPVPDFSGEEWRSWFAQLTRPFPTKRLPVERSFPGFLLP